MSSIKFLKATTVTVLILILSLTATAHSYPPSDRVALLAFRAAFHDPYLSIFNSWTDTDWESWVVGKR
ncbi:unnamed protein product [Lathyrus sativus]|nr:unnamed protein product [Lathyrus sativus]